MYADILNFLLLGIVKLVEIAAYLRQIHILVEMVFEIFNRRRLA